MAKTKTLTVFLLLLLGYGLLWLPVAVWDRDAETALAAVVRLPMLTPYLLQGIGVPGMIQNGGACGWGWCAPSALGWVTTAIVWGLVAAGVAAVVSRLLRKG